MGTQGQANRELANPLASLLSHNEGVRVLRETNPSAPGQTILQARFPDISGPNGSAVSMSMRLPSGRQPWLQKCEASGV